jgi:oxygen-independent coproporphyrinogen-3 oxidase
MPIDPVDMDRTLAALAVPCSGNKRSTLYIHIPFCDQVCSFCGFNKSVSPEAQKARYVEALIEEMRLYSKADYIQSLKVGAVYLGGGTPNCLSPEQLDRILSHLHQWFPIDKDVEITCEGVIQNFTPERIAVLKRHGVNRVSAGIQTFDREIRIEHLHMRDGKEELLSGIANLRTNFSNFNLDFIYNLPNQTDDIWAEDVDLALASGATHLTFYPLVLLENTAFYSDYVKTNKYEAPSQEREIKLFQYTLDRVKSSRYTNQYSVRDWAIPGHDCRYIRMNAESNNIVALGAGAHGYISGMTYRNVRSVNSYISTLVEQRRIPIEAQRFSTEAEQMQRYMVMGLRLMHLDMRPFYQRFGVTFSDVYADKIEDMVAGGYIHVNGDRLAFTPEGDIWANNVRTYFEGKKGINVGYADTTSIGQDGKTHYSAITRIKAVGDVEANV